MDTAQAHYNRGNALAKAGKLESAIEAYDAALEIQPDHADALYNRDLVEDFLEKNPQASERNQPSGGDQGAEEQQQQQAQSSGESGEGEQGEGEQQDGDPSDEQQQANAGESDGDSSQDQPQDESQTDGDTGEQQAESQEQEPADSEQLAQAAEDVEQWASEQAAEQWLRRIPQDPGGLLRRKFLYQYQRLGVDQDGNSVWPAETDKPW